MIRLLQVDELEKVTDLAQWYFYQCKIPGSFSKECFVKTWKNFIQTNVGLIIARLGDTGPVEAIGVLIYPDPNDGMLVASVVFWYVLQEDSLAKGLLYAKLEQHLRGMEIKRIYTTSLLNHRHDRVSSFLIHAGFSPFEVHFGKELAPWP